MRLADSGSTKTSVSPVLTVRVSPSSKASTRRPEYRQPASSAVSSTGSLPRASEPAGTYRRLMPTSSRDSSDLRHVDGAPLGVAADRGLGQHQRLQSGLAVGPGRAALGDGGDERRHLCVVGG